MEEAELETIELNNRRVKIWKMHVHGKELITNGIKLDFEQIIGYPNEIRDPYLLLYYEERKLDTKAGTDFRFSEKESAQKNEMGK
jgi:hypothetical protein